LSIVTVLPFVSIPAVNYYSQYSKLSFSQLSIVAVLRTPVVALLKMF